MENVIISLCSDDEEEQTVFQPPQNAKKQPPVAAAGMEIVEILDDSDDDDENNRSSANNQNQSFKTNYSNTAYKPMAANMTRSVAMVSQETRPFKRRKPNDGRNKVNHAVRQADDDLSDSDDSLSQYQCSGLRVSRKKQPALCTQSQELSEAEASAKTPAIANPYAKATRTPSTHSSASQSLCTPRQQLLSQESHSSAVSSSSIVNPYAKKKTPSSSTTATTIATRTPSSGSVVIRNPYSQSSTPASTSSRLSSLSSRTPEVVGVVYPSLLPNSKTYPDERARFLLAFWSYSRRLTQHSHDRAKLDTIAKKIVALAFYEYPIRSLEEYCFRVISSTAVTASSQKHRKEDIQEQLELGGLTSKRIVIPIDACSNGKYFTIAEACLVSMFLQVKQKWRQAGTSPLKSEISDDEALGKSLSPKEMWVSLEFLLAEIDTRLQPDCPARICRSHEADNGVAYYTNPSTRSAEYKQIEKLLVPPRCEIFPYLKLHKIKGQPYFELTPFGFHQAEKVQSRVFPEPSGHYRCSNLETVGPKYKGICLGVDSREGGGGKKVLHSMCNKLDMTKLPYFVGTICIGDYCFFASDTNQLCPILVERKSIQDVALSIHDGRWTSQKRRMYHGQYVFGYDNCRIAFLIEGKEEKQQVTGGYIGHRRFNVTRERLDEELQKLEKEGFDVLRTTSPENSMFELSRWAQRVGQEVRNGTLKLKYTYEEFKRKIKKIPATTDFSRLAVYAKEEAEQKKAQPEEQKQQYTQHSYSALDSDEDDSDIEMIIPSKLDYAAKKSSAQDNRDYARQKRSVPEKRDSKPTAQQKRELILKQLKEQKQRLCLTALGIDEGDRDIDMIFPSKLASLEENRYSALLGRGNAEREAASGGKQLATRQKMEKKEDYSKWSNAQLQEECAKYGLAKSGAKAKLIERLQGPRPPKVWLERKKRGEYVPSTHDCASTALLVALLLLEKEQPPSSQQQHPGFEKDVVYVKAEELGITKNPFSGGTTQTGPYHYDGWSSMKYLLMGDPPLVTMKRRKFKLTRSCGISGYPLAEALHKWCHEHNHCSCEDLV